MLIKKSQTTLEHFAKGKVFDYPMPEDKIGISYQEHNGRAPENGWGINKECYEIYFIIDGLAEVLVDSERYEVEKGDVVIIYPHQKSYMVARDLKLVTITSPNWDLKQYTESK